MDERPGIAPFTTLVFRPSRLRLVRNLGVFYALFAAGVLYLLFLPSARRAQVGLVLVEFGALLFFVSLAMSGGRVVAEAATITRIDWLGRRRGFDRADLAHIEVTRHFLWFVDAQGRIMLHVRKFGWTDQGIRDCAAQLGVPLSTA